MLILVSKLSYLRFRTELISFRRFQWERGSLDVLHQVCTMQLNEMCTLQSKSGFPGEPEAACYSACQEEDGVSWVLHVLYYLGGVAKSSAAQRWDGLGSGTCCRLARWLCWAVWRTPCADQSALEGQPRVRFFVSFPIPPFYDRERKWNYKYRGKQTISGLPLWQKYNTADP